MHLRSSRRQSLLLPPVILVVVARALFSAPRFTALCGGLARHRGRYGTYHRLTLPLLSISRSPAQWRRGCACLAGCKIWDQWVLDVETEDILGLGAHSVCPRTSGLLLTFTATVNSSGKPKLSAQKDY